MNIDDMDEVWRGRTRDGQLARKGQDWFVFSRDSSHYGVTAAEARDWLQKRKYVLPPSLRNLDGRPGEGRTEILKTYVTPQEKAAARRWADDSGTTVSDWVRNRLFG